MTSKILTNKKNELQGEYENCFDILFKKNDIKSVSFPSKENKDNSYIHFLKDDINSDNKKFRTAKIEENKIDKRDVSLSINRKSKKKDKNLKNEEIKNCTKDILKNYNLHIKTRNEARNILQNNVKKCIIDFTQKEKEKEEKEEKKEKNNYTINKKKIYNDEEDKYTINKKEKVAVKKGQCEANIKNKNNIQKDKYENLKKQLKSHKTDKYRKNILKKEINLGNNFFENVKDNEYEEYNYEYLYRNEKRENEEKSEICENMNGKNINRINMPNFKFDNNLGSNYAIDHEINKKEENKDEIHNNILENKKEFKEKSKFIKKVEKSAEHYFLSYLPYEIKNNNTDIKNNDDVNTKQINIRNNKSGTYLNKSVIMNSLINNIRNYTNYEYVVEKKLCYNCFISKNKERFNNSCRYMYIDKYMKIIKNKKEKNEFINNSFTFTYGFYCKTGKYHANEETASHALFSSYKILNEIHNLFNYVNKKKKYNFFEELFKIFNINSSATDQNRSNYKTMNSYMNKENNIKNMKHDIVSSYYNEEIPKVYLKFSLPLYSLDGNLEDHSKNNYQIIYNYFLPENDKNLVKRISNNSNLEEKCKKKSNNTNILYKIDDINYNIRDNRNLMEFVEENAYYTHQNIKVLQNYDFICKLCKKTQSINKKKKFEISYLNYLFNVSGILKKKKKKKNEIFHGLNDSNNSSGSNEYNFLNYSNRYLNKNNQEKYGTTNNNCNDMNYNNNNNNGTYKCNNKKDDVDNYADPLIINKNDERDIKYINEIKKNKNYSISNEKIIEKFKLSDYLIKCKTCRHLHKYDNLCNDYLFNFCRNNQDYKYPFLLNLSEENMYKFFENYEKRNDDLKSYIINELYKSNYEKKVKYKEDFTENYVHSYSDLESYENKEKLIIKSNEKKYKKNKNGVNTLYRNKSSIEKNPFKLKKENNFNYLKARIKPEIKKYIIQSRRQLFQEYYDNLKKIKKVQNLEKNKNLKEANLRNVNTKDNKNVSNEYDMHLFTICDGHSDSHTSLFLIHNVHKIFYFLLIHTFFNIHYSFKLLHPLMDLLYYKMCVEQNLSKCCGSCIINVLIKNNYIYVSNIGDSKCALITFDLDKFEYTEKKGNLLKKKKKKKRAT